MLNVLDHPLVKHKISILRDKNTTTKEFREIIKEITILLCYEAMKDCKVYEKEVESPIKKTTGHFIDEDAYAFVPILRAGLGMVEGIVDIIPNAKIGHIGLYRNEETLKPVKYYYKMPDGIENKTAIIMDPMFATGGSVLATIELLKNDGVKNIKFLSIFAAPEGIEVVKNKYPDVEIYTAVVDEKLNEVSYIVPGCGDAGDRIFGTK